MYPYVRYPTVHGDRVAFVTDDDLWMASLAGGPTRRVTAVQGEVAHPRFSPDGAHIAYRSTRDGANDVYACDSDGGPSRRLTFLGSVAAVCGFSADGAEVIFASAATRPSPKEVVLWAVPLAGGVPRRLPWGLGQSIAPGTEGGLAIARHSDDLARWKRYRGGRRGAIWIKADAETPFARLDVADAAAVDPMWLGERLWFVSDEAYVGNLWSCARDGSDRRQETDHTDCVRHANTDGETIVYASGTNLMRLVPGGSPELVDLDHASPAEHLGRKQATAKRFLEEAALHPDGRALALTVRGKPVTLGTWEGAATQLGQRHGVRYRLLRFLADGQRLVCFTDASGEESLAVIDGANVHEVPGTGPARAIELVPAPKDARVAWVDDRGGAWVVDLDTEEVTELEQNDRGRCAGMAWSSDGRWLAWSSPVGRNSTQRIRLWCADDGQISDVTDGRFDDFSPTFDPAGRFLAFLSKREFDPVYDQAYFDVNFPLGVRPYLVTLTARGANPLLPEPSAVKGKKNGNGDRPTEIEIDRDGIIERLVRLPMQSRRYLSLAATDGALIAESEPVEGVDASAWQASGPPPAKRSLHIFHWKTLSETNGFPRISGFSVSADASALLLRVRDRLRVIEVPEPEKKLPTSTRNDRKSGWVDLGRVTVAIEPRAEWSQMLRETWRWMRDRFWVDDHSGVDWNAQWHRYSPRLERVATRSEYADLVWTMIAELATSHCYEMMGDYRSTPGWRVGHLAAELSWDDGAGGWRIDRLARGEAGDRARSSPLAQAGVGCVPGDVLVSIDGLPTNPGTPVGEHLIDRGGKPVAIEVRRVTSQVDTVTVRPLRSQDNAWYKEWVRSNRERVHAETGGRVGYVHIPDMGPAGYADFHRDYLRESDRDALIVDVRYNRGGHVSQLLLEKLRRKPIGFNVSRWDGVTTYPGHAVRGPMVAITNEMAGSDGDIFSHCFKLYDLGPLIGTRTWGGVIGIWPRARHADGGLTTQPEYSFWFNDVGYAVENYGTDPDIELDHSPEDWANGADRQLDRALQEIEALLAAEPPAAPDFSKRPYLGL